MMNIDAMNQASARATAAGIRVLNAFLLADTEAAHVARLLELLHPLQGAVVVDAGCGVGEVAKLMAAARPDLDFKLVNLSAEQLAECPAGMERIRADFADMPLGEGSADVVMFNYSLCHADDWGKALREAFRVLKPGGVLFINDMARSSGDNALMEVALQAHAYAPDLIVEAAKRAGFDLNSYVSHAPVVHRLRDVFADRDLYERAFQGVYPATFRLIRQDHTDPIASAFARHQRVGFQISGGRDSTAALHRLRDYWDRMTVYHLDTGDQFPETRDVVRELEKLVPIVRIQGNVQAVREQFGMPSDLVPVDNGDPGRLVSGREVKLQSRYECCARSLMLPMHARMKADGISLIVRGQRDDEYATPPKRSGDVAEGFEVLYPIQDWTADQVTAYLKGHNLPMAPFYQRGMSRAPECMRCTAWWDEGRIAYLRDWHPMAFHDVKGRLAVIRSEIDRQYSMLEA